MVRWLRRRRFAVLAGSPRHNEVRSMDIISTEKGTAAREGT